MRLRLVTAACALAAFTLACGGSDGGGGTSPTQPVLTSVSVSPAAAQMQVGDTQPFTVTLHDQFGGNFTASVTWTSSATSVATVDQTGSVHAVGAGTSTITATAGGKSSSATVTVIAPAVASVVVNGQTSMAAGSSTTLTTVLKDKNGNVLSGRVVTWSSSNSRVVIVDATGKVTALYPGTVTITATSETVVGTLSIVVTAATGGSAPSISGVSPATLTPGVVVTISGTNFGSSAGTNTVFVNGVAATLTSASSTQLTFSIPASLPCQATQSVNVDVVTVGGTATATPTLQVANSRALAVGGSFFATASGNIACNELPNAGTYLVSVFNAATSFDQIAGVQLTGAVSASGGSVASIATRVIAPRQFNINSALSADANSAEAAHIRLLEQAMRDVSTFHRSRASRSVAPGGSVPGRNNAPVPLTVGATATINFNYTGCSASASKPKITSRVVYVGPKVIVLEDNAGALAGKIDADLIGMAQDFENVSFPILLNNFGNPLAYDDSTDNNGRIIMMFTPQVNAQASNLLGFVQPCDLISAGNGSSFATTNQAEIFYARAVTDTSATNTSSIDSRAGWKRQMPGTLIHETKHIISFAERFATPVLITQYEETWLEEATAQLASEMYGRAIHGNTFRGDAQYTGVIDCEVRPTVGGCNGGVFVMGNHFGFLTDFLENFESKSILRNNGDGSSDDDIYGSSWMFTRWLTDTYATTESSFIKSMVLNFNVVGVNNATSVSGKTWPELLSNFTLMFAADDINTAPAQFQEASWNLPKIWAGYNADFPSRPVNPFAPRTAVFGTSFVMTAGQLQGGGAMVVKLNPGGAGPQLLDLHAPNGSPLPSNTNVGIAVLRIQ